MGPSFRFGARCAIFLGIKSVHTIWYTLFFSFLLFSAGELGKTNPKKPIVSEKTTIRVNTTGGGLPEPGEQEDSPETGVGQVEDSPETGGGSLVREERSQPQGEELFIVEGEDGSSWLVTTGGQEEQLEGGDRPVSTGHLIETINVQSV